MTKEIDQMSVVATAVPESAQIKASTILTAGSKVYRDTVVPLLLKAEKAQTRVRDDLLGFFRELHTTADIMHTIAVFNGACAFAETKAVEAAKERKEQDTTVRGICPAWPAAKSQIKTAVRELGDAVLDVNAFPNIGALVAAVKAKADAEAEAKREAAKEAGRKTGGTQNQTESPQHVANGEIANQTTAGVRTNGEAIRTSQKLRMTLSELNLALGHLAPADMDEAAAVLVDAIEAIKSLNAARQAQMTGTQPTIVPRESVPQQANA